MKIRHRIIVPLTVCLLALGIVVFGKRNDLSLYEPLADYGDTTMFELTNDYAIIEGVKYPIYNNKIFFRDKFYVRVGNNFKAEGDEEIYLSMPVEQNRVSNTEVIGNSEKQTELSKKMRETAQEMHARGASQEEIDAALSKLSDEFYFK